MDVSGVVIGEGSLAGRGVYAARSFTEGEVVVPYRLSPLTREEFVQLSENEKLAVHSYFGERYLYPAPACYVNHSDNPNMVQDFEQQCYLARQPIAAGELVTIDATRETDRELETFLLVYESAINTGDRAKLGQLVDDDARLDTGALRELTADPSDGWRLALGDVHWMIGTGRWEAVLSANYELRRGPVAAEAVIVGHLTTMLKIIDGNWQIIYQHSSAV